MKKLSVIVLVAAAAIAFTSCTLVEKTSTYKALKFQKDSIETIHEQTVAELDEYLSIIQEVDSGFEAIRASENYISVSSYKDGMPTKEVKQRMADNLYTINNILQENKQKIAELEQKVQDGSIKSTQLQKTINKLTKQLEQKNKEVESLQRQLEEKNIRIDSLVVENQVYADQARLLTEEMDRQTKTIQDQDSIMHTGYYLMANKKALKEYGVDANNPSSAFRTSIFTPVDIRTLETLETNSKSARILTKHPASSYVLERNEERKYVLVIKNSTDFWSTSKYLIIKVD